VDETTLEIISVAASANDVNEAEALPDLLEDAPGGIELVRADGVYDQRRRFDTLNRRGDKAAIPPRKGAKIWRRADRMA